MTDDRLSVTPFIFGNVIGPTPASLQIAESFPQHCFTATVTDNDDIDGDNFFNIYLELVGSTISQSQPAFLGSNNATLAIRDNDGKS